MADPLDYSKEDLEAIRATTNTGGIDPINYERQGGLKNTLGAGDYARGALGGAVDVLTSTAEGLSALTTGNSQLTRSISRTREHFEDMFTGDIPDELKSKFSYSLARGIGMIPPFLGLAIGTRGASVLVKGASWLGLGSNAYQQGRDDYIASTGDPNRELTDEEFNEASVAGGVSGIPLLLLNTFGINQVANVIFRGANSVTAKTALQRIKSMAKPIVAEGGTEGAQQFTQNLIAKELLEYDPERELNSGLIESIAIGALASGTYTVPTQMYQFNRLNEGIQKGEINPEELNDDLGRRLMEDAVVNDGVPRTGTDELSNIHSTDSVKALIENTLVPLTTKLTKAGGEYAGVFRETERQLGVQQGRAKQILMPFIDKMKKLEKLDKEDYDTLADALVNASILNKGATTAESQGGEFQDNLDTNVKPQDTIEIDPTLPSGTTISEKFNIGGRVTTRNIRGLTREEIEQGVDPQDLTKKYQGVLNSVNNARQAISSIMPDTTIALYKTTKEFKEATGVKDDVRGAYINGKIHINSELADRTTVGHETFHALFLQNTGNDQVAGIRSRELLDTIFRATKDEQLKSYIADFSANYEANLQSEEALAQMFGVLSANYKPLDVSTKTKVKAWFANVARSLGLDGLFTEATTDVEIINAFNTMAQGVARGENIGNTNFQILKESGDSTIRNAHQKRFGINYVDPISNLSFDYFQNSSAMDRMIQEGRVTFGHKLQDFMKPFLVHRPDNMFTGQITLDGEVVMDGGGGIFFPANTNYFWASTKREVDKMVERLNKTSDPRTEGSDGKVRLVLTSAKLNKVQGNSDFLKGTVKITYKGMEKALPQKFKKDFEKDFRRILKEANKKKHPQNNKSLDLDIDFDNAPMSEIFEQLDAQVVAGEFFKQRTAFVQDFFRKFTLLQKRQQGKRTPYAQAIYDALPTFLNASKYLQESARGKRSKGKLPIDFTATEIQSAYEYMFSEPLLRGYDPFLAKQTAKTKNPYTTVPVDHAYAIVEMPGRVKAIDIPGENASYDTAIVSETGEKPTIHILSDRVFWDDFADIKAHNFIGSDGKPKDHYKQVMTDTGGVGNEIITKFKKNYKGFSITERELYEPLIQGNPELKNLYETVYPKQMSLRLQKITEFQYTDEEAINALPKKEKAKYNRHKTDRIPIGAIRLNLASQFTKEGVEGPLFVQTLHKIGKSGKPNYGEAHSYGRAFTVKNASFTVNPIATALIRNGAMNKFPMASVNGTIDYEQEGSLEGERLSFNPIFNDFFVDSQGRFVKGAEEITVYGRGAYARGKIEYFDKAPEVIPSADDVISFLKGKKFVHPIFHPRGLVAGKSIKDKQSVINKIKNKQAEEAQVKQEEQEANELANRKRRQAQTADILRMQKLPDETFEQARNRILDKHNMTKEFDQVRKLLQYLYEGGMQAGIDVSYLENYFPRMVKDIRGLQESFRGVHYDSELDRKIDEVERTRGKNLTEEERLRLIENLIVTKSMRYGLKTRPNQMKARKIDVIDRERRKKFYGSSEEALVSYVDSMVASIEQKNLLKKTSLLMDRDRKNGTLTADAERLINDAFDARFGQHGKQSQIIKGMKNAGYIATMGNVGSAITQLGDFYFTAVQTGLGNTLKGAFQATGKNRITREDVMGLKNIVTAEAQDGAGALQNAVEFFFKASGISQIDAFAKTTNINANYNMMRKAVRNFDSKEYKKLYNELVKFQGVNDANKAISDLQSGIKSDQVLQALYNRLANVAPISLSEMPENYSKSPNGRIFYSLKSYTIKQFDFIRQQSFQKMQKKETFAEGFLQLFRIAMLSMLANGSADVLKAILFNREISEEEFFWNNILRMFGITKYTTVKARKEGLGSALVSTVLPPQIGMVNDVTKDFDRSVSEGEFEVDELRSVKYIPIVGKLYYWREGRGVEVEERLSRLRD